jgi:hypothetical protein
MQQNQKPATLLREIGTNTAVAGGLLAMISGIILLWTYYALPFFKLGCYVLLGGLAVVVLHYVLRLLVSVLHYVVKLLGK